MIRDVIYNLYHFHEEKVVSSWKFSLSSILCLQGVIGWLFKEVE